MYGFRIDFYIAAIFWMGVSIALSKGRSKSWEKNDTLFSKILIQCTFLILELFFVNLMVINIPLVINCLYTEHNGIIIECEKIPGAARNEYAVMSRYNITLREENKIYQIGKVRTYDELSSGMSVEIREYEAKAEIGSFVISINEEQKPYYIRQFKESSRAEKLIVLMLVTFHTIWLIKIVYKKIGNKEYILCWGRIACIGVTGYAIALWLSYWYPYWSRVLGNISGICLGIFFIADTVLDWKINKQVDRAFVSAEKSINNENQTTNEEIFELTGTKPKSIEKDYPLCQFTPVSNTLSRQYCTYRYKKEMKEWIHETILISIAVIILIFVAAVALEGKEILVIEAGILLFPVCVGGYYWIGKKKCRKYEQAAKDYRACESCEVTMALREKHKYIYSNGQEKIVRMERDMDGKIKDGQPAVIVYIPLADKFYTDKPETIEMIKEKY